MINLESNTFKACPECGQALKLHYRYCIRCGLECPIPLVTPESEPEEVQPSPDSEPVAASLIPTAPEPVLHSE